MKLKAQLSACSIFLFPSAALAEMPAILPGGEDMSASLPNEKIMILVFFLVQVVWALLSYIWKAKEKRENKSEEKLDRLYKIVHELQSDVHAIRSSPNEEELIVRIQPLIELGVLRAIKKYEDRE